MITEEMELEIRAIVMHEIARNTALLADRLMVKCLEGLKEQVIPAVNESMMQMIQDLSLLQDGAPKNDRAN